MTSLLRLGLSLLAGSLLLTVALSTWQSGQVDQLEVLMLVSWLSQALLYVGSGLVVAALVLRALRPEEEVEPDLDWYVEQ